MEVLSKRQNVGKELKINLKEHPDFTVNVGSAFYRNPTAVYINISSWVVSSVVIDDKYLKNLNKNIKKIIYAENNNDLVFNLHSTISILDITTSDIITSKPNIVSIDITLFQKNRNNCLPWTDYNLQQGMEYYANLVISELKKNNDFKFQLRRK